MKWTSGGTPEERKAALQQLIAVGSGKSPGQHVFDMFCNRMSSGEMREWMKKEDGLRVLLERDKHDPIKRKKLHIKISEKVLERALVKWQQCMAEAREMAKGVEATDDSIVECAEKIMVREHYLPFYWKDFLECDHCGLVVVKDNRLPCPWCEAKEHNNRKDNEHGNETHKERNDGDVHEELGGGLNETLGSVCRDGQSSGSDAGGRRGKFRGLPSMAAGHGAQSSRSSR